MVDYWASEEMDIYCDGSSMGRAPMLCAYDKSLLLDCFLVLLTVILAFILLTMFRVIRCGFTMYIFTYTYCFCCHWFDESLSDYAQCTCIILICKIYILV